MKEVQFSVLPSVQNFLEPDLGKTEESMIHLYCQELKEVCMTLTVIKVRTTEKELPSMLEPIIKKCAYLYADLNDMEQEMVDYYKEHGEV